MSGAIRIAKAQYRGDPGLFSFVGKALGGIANVVSKVVPGPIGAVAGLAGRVLAGNGKPQNPSIARAAPVTAINVASSGMFAGPAPQLPVLRPDSTVTTGTRIPGIFETGRTVQHFSPGNQTQSGLGAGASTQVACQSGYHRNKSGYYSQRYGWVPAGSVCVRNRRRNPLNPRAASRAMSRLTSARKATRAIQKFFGGPRPSSAPARKGPCGCKRR